jgi:hypothetical protein
MEHVLSFSTDGEQVFIHADAAGLDFLIKTLTNIRTKIDEDVCEHDHLFTDSWGSGELSDGILDKDAHLVNHVKVCGWTNEWAEKHGLTRK